MNYMFNLHSASYLRHRYGLWRRIATGFLLSSTASLKMTYCYGSGYGYSRFLCIHEMQSFYVSAIYRKSQWTSCNELSLTFGSLKILAMVVICVTLSLQWYMIGVVSCHVTLHALFLSSARLLQVFSLVKWIIYRWLYSTRVVVTDTVSRCSRIVDVCCKCA